MMAHPRIWHFITCEYPPQPGGVSDYVYLLAQHLPTGQDHVHVWRPSAPGDAPELPRVTVHDTLGNFSPRDLRRASRELSTYEAPRRLLVHWVPHGYGYRSMNMGFCLWLWNRVRRHGDLVDLMVHEPFLSFGGGWRQTAAAAVHRAMTVILLHAARHVWMSTPSWKSRLEPFALGRRLDFEWLPVSGTVPRANDASAVQQMRARYASTGPLIGHFGTFRPPISGMLETIIPGLLERIPDASMLMIGGGGNEFRDRVARVHPNLSRRLHATGYLDGNDPALPASIGACDLFVQPYPDGVTGRRTTVMSILSNGRPVVTTAGEFTETFWRTRQAVVLAPAVHPAAFIKAAAGAMRNKDLGAAGKLFYDECFRIERAVELLRRAPAVWQAETGFSEAGFDPRQTSVRPSRSGL